MIRFISGKLNSKISENTIKSYNNLSKDKYLDTKNCYRYRAFSEIFFKNKNIIIRKKREFFQKKEINHFAGNISRKFQSIETVPLNNFIIITKELIKFLPSKYMNYSEIGLHQIRIKCTNDFVGYPVPEGWHKDKCDYVAVITINYDNIVGGVSRIRQNLNDQNDVYNSFLKKKNYLLLNEKSFYHYTDPINVKNKKKKGFRDILVITVNG